jgi:ABC-type nitrate/sulfonate/bicarbonate transport system substrate-binding protein
MIVVPKNVNSVEELRGKTVGYGRQGSADYDEGQAVMQRAFKMEVGRDYKVIAFQGETDRIAALINGDIQAALLSVPHAVKAVAVGLKILVRVGDYIPRAGGTVWARQEFVEQNPIATKKFIRAVANAVTLFRSNKEASVRTLRKYYAIDNDNEADQIWDQLHDSFGAELPPELFAQIIESRIESMKAARQWPADRPMPDPEQWLMRDLLDSTLKEMGYVPTKLDKPKI